MYIKTLVEGKIRDGKRLIRVADRAKLGLRVAFWFFDLTIHDWRLVIFFDDVDRVFHRAAYGILAVKVFARLNSISFKLSDIMVQSSQSELVRAVASRIQTAPDAVSDIRLESVQVGGIRIESAYIYRCALVHQFSFRA